MAIQNNFFDDQGGFNGVFASLVSWALRTWTWHQYKVYIDIQALQISLLGGRIFFTGLRYHGANETILVQNGYITWKYWLRRVRGVKIPAKGARGHNETNSDSDADPITEQLPTTKLPCRISVCLSGLEWFIYNRSPAYDSILSGLTDLQEDAVPAASGTEPVGAGDGAGTHEAGNTRKRRSRKRETLRKSEQTQRSGATQYRNGRPIRDSSTGRASTMASSDSEDDEEHERDGQLSHELPLFLQMLPLQLEVTKAAMVMGNENTKAILIVKTESMEGEVDASATETPDPYRQFFRFKFNHPVIEMKENLDYKEDQADRATRDKQTTTHDPISVHHRPFFKQQMRRLMGRLHRLCRIVPFHRNRSVESLTPDAERDVRTATSHISTSNPNNWQGLSRYLDSKAHDLGGTRPGWASSEYAAVPTILDSPEATLTILWDVVGKVQRAHTITGEKVSGHLLDINGEEPPAWSIQLSVKGGSINYGPWADRQRADLQRTFVPNICKDATAATRLPVGAYRVPTKFNFYIEFGDTVTLRVPVREESKNWKWQGKQPATKPPVEPQARKHRGRPKKAEQPATIHQRPYGWLDIKVAKDATMSYTMDMVAGAAGFSNQLILELPSTEISSSINHELLWKSGKQQISCDLSTPLGWNALREWRFKITSSDLDLFILRDHVFLLTDLVGDWASGPPPEYLVFTPFKYHVELQLQNLQLFLNLNDANIVNNPTDLDDNTYFIIASPLLRSKLTIPIDNYRPNKNAIPFNITASNASVTLHVPPWNTQASFLDTKEVGRLENMVVDGAYHYHTITSAANTDTLILNFSAQSLFARVYGFTVRYGMKIKDNYFGEDVHFKTLDEHQDMLRLRDQNPDAETTHKPPPKKSSDLDVILSVRCDQPKILIPANLYSSTRHVVIDTASFGTDLRFTNYYMEMDLEVAPLQLSLGSSDSSGADTPKSATGSNTQLFIDGIHVYGHRLFGLPHAEPTYLCNWDLSLGTVTGECTTEFLATLVRGGNAFGFSFDDDENALISAASIVLYDVTFLRVYVQSVDVWFHVEEAAFLVSTGSINVDFNDWARSHYSRRANIKIPHVKISCINAEHAARQKIRSSHPIETDALLETSVSLAIIGRKHDFSIQKRRQQEFVRREDQRTHRTPFLLLSDAPEGFIPDIVDPPAQSVPPMPVPTKADEVESDRMTAYSGATSKRSRSLRHKSSFLSFTSENSVVRPRSIRSSVRVKQADRLSPFASYGRQSRGSGGHVRDTSPSTRHSGFYSAFGDNTERQDLMHNTVAFSSQYFAPYFPLENLKMSYKDAAKISVERDDESEAERNSLTFELGDIDPDSIPEDCAYSSIILEMPSGVKAFCNPAALRHVITLLSSLQPSDPEDILDSIQSDSMKAIFGMQKDQKMKGHVSDILVKIPRADVRFANPFESDPANSLDAEEDQYSLSITKLALASRSETKWQDAFKPEAKQTRSSIHIRLQSIEASAAERYHDAFNSPAAVRASVENIMISMGTRDITYLDVDMGAITSSTSSEKIDYLASLIHRTSVLASDFGRLFDEKSAYEKNMPKNMIKRLIRIGQDAPDPGFLVRPSAILRSAPEHLRSFDCWKLVMRLRQMWSVQSQWEKEQLVYTCLDKTKTPPTNLRQEVIAAFEKWRSWDLGDVANSPLINTIFGPTKTLSGPPKDRPILAVVKIKQIQFILDPGPKQNEIMAVALSIRADTRQASGAEARFGNSETTGRLTILNISCSDAAINLNWELCELVTRLLELVDKLESKPPTARKTASLPSTKKIEDHTIHCVLAVGHGSIALETINLHISSIGSGLSASLLLQLGKDDKMDTNMIFNCDSVISSLRSHSEGVAKLVLQRPSVFVSHELKKSQAVDSHTIKATASSHHLSFVVKQDPVYITELLDLVVRDEVAKIYKLSKKVLSSTPSVSAPKKIVDRLSAFRVNVAMFMDQYTISIPLLRSLTYTVNGTVARVAMAANFGREIIFDFDVKENSHEIRTKRNNITKRISLLQIPPTNGQIRNHTTDSEHSLTVFASLELVELDASAVYSFLSALNRPEVSSAVTELQQQGKAIQEHIKEITGSNELTDMRASSPETPQAESKLLVYAINLTFAGLRVFGNSPLNSEVEPLAHIAFNLDKIHLGTSNRVEQQGPLLAYPEFHINIQEVAFEIQKGNTEAMRSCGNLGFGALITATSNHDDDGKEQRIFNVKSDAFHINLSPNTVSTVVDVLGYMGDKIKDLDTSRELEYLRKLRQSKPRIVVNDLEVEEEEDQDIVDVFLSSFTYTFEICNIQLAWLVNHNHPGEPPDPDKEDLVLSLDKIEFSTRTRNSARLTIENLRLQMVSREQDWRSRSPSSALLPEIMFNIAYVSMSDTRRLAFQAVGKTLDIRLTSGFILPAAHLTRSISLSINNVQQASQNWNPSAPPTVTQLASSPEPQEQIRKRSILGSKRLESLLVDADFAGAVVHLTGKRTPSDLVSASRLGKPSTAGKGQFGQEEWVNSVTTLRSPGLALKMEYCDDGREDPSLFAEVKIDASSNILYPSVVPLIVEMSNNIKSVVSERGEGANPPSPPQAPSPPRAKPTEEDGILGADPTAVLGRVKLNLGLRVRKQEFSLSCQPIALVAATASFDDVYFTANTVRSADQGNFFAISGAFSNLQASVQHVYSRESTGSFKVDSIVLSLMNSKHVSGTNGLSAILKVSPMEVSINAKQLQDFMLFQEIWVPRQFTETTPSSPVAKLVTETSQGHLVQRYQQVAATAAFPWTATISITALKISVDLGQALGKSTFSIGNFWISSKKTSDWEQNLCLGFDMIGMESQGRMSGFVALRDFKLRTSIKWPEREQALNETPLVQASVGFSQLRVKAAFDYQAFLIADITSMEFLMYNVRRSRQGTGDRLVAIFNGNAVQIFGTTSSAAQGVAMYQAFQRLIQERKANFESSLKEIERFMRRKSVTAPAAVIKRLDQKTKLASEADDMLSKSPISLDTDVVVTLKALNLGIFPGTFADSQVFKVEALNAQARFAASIEDRRIHSILGLTLGQLRIGLAGVRATGGAPKTLSELSVEDVVQSATGSRGGTILKVPQVEAVMQTWQRPDSRSIDYIFKSAFEGKVEVGWNYSRISFIRGMWANHSKTLQRTWGKELPPVTAIRVTGVPEGPADDTAATTTTAATQKDGEQKQKGQRQSSTTSISTLADAGPRSSSFQEKEKSQNDKQQSNKITAEVKVPQSKYEYTALEPPVIETPQLRDMGEATPPLEWIGLHRDRLPNLTHQIVIVSLLELAGEVEDAYSKILGST
ncbi:hypothetical protein QBC32DRAFT_377428 [Pseudoneurospora amorphoporcata]|uniref:Fermentation associated protein n=1 Tax=Pseudoneurospora amorphoporcata TaxID=241081 RepID=A0AAN6SD68_9PEZI|nr:hypothetical protein QBC32DRAFT_377428 [Pseudoneurospora amorphoporcata]